MRPDANCCDNARMWSFFGSLGTKLVHGRDFGTPAEARAVIVEDLEVF
jgi:hypothetical protein